MARKRWEAKSEITPEILNAREKRKWQITLRRYAIEKQPCPSYAPYFGLDIVHIRKWFECQFAPGVSWDTFGRAWQFSHRVPVSNFDHNRESDLRLCWNYLNLAVEPVQGKGHPLPGLLEARQFFTEVYSKTEHPIAEKMLYKILQIEKRGVKVTEAQKMFLLDHKDYFTRIIGYAAMEFELLNKGRNPDEVEREISFLKKNIQS